MKTLLVCTMLLMVSMITEGQKSSVSGTIEGITNDTLTIFFLPLKGNDLVIDKVICKNGKVNYEVQLISHFPHLVRIESNEWVKKFSVNAFPYYLEREDINFYIHSGEHIRFTARPETNAIYLQAYGNSINEQRNELLETHYPLYSELNAAFLKFAKAKVEKDSLHINEGIQSLESINQKINKGTIEFILKHPDWDISADMLMHLPTDSCVKYFESLSPKVQSSFFGQSARNILFTQKVGEQAVPFSLPDPQGKQISLSDYKGKYVVIDFWGTWCGGCVRDLPKMKQFFDQYKDQVEFISIACNDAQKTWEEAIKKYEMNWVNLLNPDDKLTVAYGIKAYPTKLIIDPEGKVIGKYRGQENDFYTKLDKLFKN
ncbi:MAG TPA: TlpA disulfide reductase family protein [Prolixibacteraceae bacterium]|nr:TlpA disulfide reductase family protein [Prolixibacteraceae bacterium]